MSLPFKMPQIPDYGYLGGFSIRPTEAPDIPTPMAPEAVAEHLAGYSQPPRMPDIVRAHYGSSDREMVGRLLMAAAGEESGLQGVSPTMAAGLLEGWGYPTTMDAMSADEWEQALMSHVNDYNPIRTLGWE